MLRMRKAISRSALVQLVVVELAEQLKKGAEEIDNLVNPGGLDEGTLGDTKRRGELRLTAQIDIGRSRLVAHNHRRS